MFQHLECIVWSVYISGVYGSIGPNQEGKEVSVHAMAVCTDPLTGKAFAGPASLQSPPSNVLPELDLEIDNDGNIWVKPPNWSPNGNGIVGYGRFIKE